MAKNRLPGQSALDDSAEEESPPSVIDFNSHLKAPSASSTPWKKSSKEEIQRLTEELELLRAQLKTQSLQSIIPVNGVIHAGRFELSMISMLAPDDVASDELELFAGFLKAVIKAYQFWAGDLGNIYFQMYGVLHTDLARYLEVDPETLDKWMRVCEKIPPRMRIQELDYTHHLEVANKADKLGDRIEEVLKHAKKFDLNTRELKQYIAEVLRGKKTPRRVPLDTLLSKDRTPGLVELRKDYAAARRGDNDARQRVKEHIKTYRDWLQDLEESLGLR